MDISRQQERVVRGGADTGMGSMRNSLFPENGLHTLSVGHHECDSHFETFISSKACKNSFKYYHSRGTVNNYIVFRLVQFLSPLLLPKDAKILQFMYKYGQAMRPPPVKRTRCLDALEPYFKPLLLTAAKITFQDTETKRGEASRAIANLKESFKRMSVKSFYPHTEQSTLNNKLRRMRIYYFYPYETKEYQYMRQWYRSWKKLQYKYGQIVKSFRNAGFEFAKSQAHKSIQDFEWKGSVFQQDPYYDADNNALYIPASLFEPPLYYGDSFL